MAPMNEKWRGDNPPTRPSSTSLRRVLRGKTASEVGAFVGAVVGVGPGKHFGVGRDLPVRAIAVEVVYVEAWLFRQMDATGRNERDTGQIQRFLRPDKGRHTILDVEAD